MSKTFAKTDIRVSKPISKLANVRVGSKKCADIAVFYGFKPISKPSIQKSDHQKTEEILGKKVARVSDSGVSIEEKVALLRAYEEENMNSWPQPVLTYYECDAKKATQNKSDKIHEIHIDILGTAKSIAEATLIKATEEILKSEGYKNFVFCLNSVGDKESSARFAREFNAHARKFTDAIHAPCRESLKAEEFDILVCDDVKCREFRTAMPESVSFLSEASRTHFREVLEFLDKMALPFTIDPTLLVSRKLVSHTIFEFKSSDGRRLAIGVRYNELSRKLGFRRELGAIGATIFLEKCDIKEIQVRDVKPKIYFIQLGYNAKLKSIEVLDMLRKYKLPVTQSIAKDKMIGQLQIAESLKIPFAFIIGQKEAMENSVIVRSLTSHSQETILLSNLPEYLKKIKLI